MLAYDRGADRHARADPRPPAPLRAAVVTKERGQPEPMPATAGSRTTVGRVHLQRHPARRHALLQLPARQEGLPLASSTTATQLLGRPATIELLDEIKEVGLQGVHHAGGLSLRHHRPADSRRQAASSSTRPRRRSTAIEKSYHAGAITERERYNQLLDVWVHCREQVTKELMQDAEGRPPRGRRHPGSDRSNEGRRTSTRSTS